MIEESKNQNKLDLMSVLSTARPDAHFNPGKSENDVYYLRIQRKDLEALKRLIPKKDIEDE